MIALALAGLLATAEPAADLGARIADSSAQAQALQGPLDGTWVVRHGRDNVLYVLQISDPAGGLGPVEGAWRGPGAGAPAGVVESITRRGRDLRIAFAQDDAAVRLRLTQRRRRAWRGWLQRGPRRLAVTLDRAEQPP